MASRISTNVVYDSRNDTSTGKKRAVFPTGGKSVAERAKLFGPQIKSAAVRTNPIQPKQNNFPPSNRDYQPLNNSPRRPLSNDYAPTNQRFFPNRQPSQEESFRSDNYDPYATADSYDYARVTRPNQRQRTPDYYDELSTPYQASVPKYEPPPPAPAPVPVPSKPVYSQVRSTIYDRPPQPQPQPQPRPAPYHPPPPINNSTRFQPIQDPLESLFNTAPPSSRTQHIPPPTTNGFNVQPFDLGNLINRIQEDYIENVRPYVASIQYVETNPIYEHTMAGLGLNKPGGVYPGQRNGPNSRPYQYIDPSRSSYYTDRPLFDSQRRHQRDQALSPIPTPKPRTPTPPPKSPTPSAHESSEEDEVAAITAAAAAKAGTTADEDEEDEDEDDEEEEEDEEEESVAPPLPPPKPIPAPVPPPAPVEPSDSEETESEESESDSDDDSDDSDNDRKKKKKKDKKKSNQKPTTAATTTMLTGNKPLTTPTTPGRLNTIGTPRGIQPISRELPARGAPATTTTTNASATDTVPSENTKDSDNFISKKGRFNIFKRIFRRK